MGKNNNYLKALNTWLKPVVQSPSSRWRRCYYTNTNGWNSRTFHSLCDNKGPTVTIVRVGEYIFGGYTKVSWGESEHHRLSCFQSRSICAYLMRQGTGGNLPHRLRTIITFLNLRQTSPNLVTFSKSYLATI